MRLKSTVVAALGAVAAIVVALVAAPQAQAMAMYDGSTYYEGGAEVTFVCGFLCGWAEHDMPYHEQVAYPDKGGSFELIGDGCIMSSGHPNLEKHGYAELVGADLNSDSNDVRWNMWGNTENVIAGSPFNVVCSPEPPGRRRLSFTRRLDRAIGIVRQFKAWDADGNGALSAAELRAGATRDFDRIDLSHDGVIDSRDVRIDLKGRSHARRRADRSALAFDLDGNGKVDANEYWRYIRRTFVKPMTHGKGALTMAEAQAFYAALQR